MPIRFTITEGTTADCRLAITLIDGILAETLIADKGYDTDSIIDFANQNEIQIVIPPKSNRVNQREYDEYLYTIRHLVENAFLKLKR